jgi:hypothetical protein
MKAYVLVRQEYLSLSFSFRSPPDLFQPRVEQFIS